MGLRPGEIRATVSLQSILIGTTASPDLLPRAAPPENAMNNPAPPSDRRPFLSLRARLMLALSLVFGVLLLFVHAFVLREFERTTLGRAQDHLRTVLADFSKRIDGDVVASMYTPQGAWVPGSKTRPIYQKNVSWIDDAALADPRLAIRVYNERPGGVLGTLDSANEPAAFPAALERAGLRELTVQSSPEPGAEPALVGAVPVLDSAGRVVCAMAVRFAVGDLYRVIGFWRERSWAVLLGAYAGLLLLFSFISWRFSAPISALAREVQGARDGNYARPLAGLGSGRLRDEVSTLAEVFEDLLSRVQQREQRLQQHIQELRIEIDQAKKERQVEEIVASESFQDLRAKARAMRQRRAEQEQQEQGQEQGTTGG